MKFFENSDCAFHISRFTRRTIYCSVVAFVIRPNDLRFPEVRKTRRWTSFKMREQWSKVKKKRKLHTRVFRSVVCGVYIVPIIKYYVLFSPRTQRHRVTVQFSAFEAYELWHTNEIFVVFSTYNSYYSYYCTRYL